MERQSTGGDEQGLASRAGPSFFAAAWLALLTVFVSALLPMEPAHARGAGSAFDPTTTIVALGTRAQGPATLEKWLTRRAAADRPLPQPAGGLDCLAAQTPLLVLPAPAARPAEVARRFDLPRAFRPALGARAPPHG